MDRLEPLSRMNLQRATPRFGLAFVAGGVAFLLMPASWRGIERLIAVWDVASTIMLMLCWTIMLRSSVSQTRQRADAQDPGRTAVWILTLLGSLFSLFAAVVLLRSPSHAGGRQFLLWGLVLWSVLGSWTLTHTSYALRYAHLYYRDDGGGEGGLDFPGKQAPDDLDFAYFSFTVGMCFQVSDVVVSDRGIRRAVLVHALLSFAYNTVILAVTLNLLFGRLG